ncbi:bifunctional AP-4-A phosphorylase/ADP sulfurylase KNAG_0C00330 [Huiozyma naganishii CBS 8797]|uniref:Uncharacterized protein n=1 Tax=Huiozyma naganishii (strain ATCC MYA-139 / BCRC 22969 / CBS 8797 / KCTC 17520 / NBRC 10181 / NCYC 3082 / Yp74L-3) TaxID=1071383 RepID=J7S5H1_HUIN7|nr:hypothetical protein KNAG_0C00330 [Kazachstania naganishii CBS 8797]CCK69146.1 hypothetical protein KNAG_0C00330 [Kazachstania naganishii CBS 8797]
MSIVQRIAAAFSTAAASEHLCFNEVGTQWLRNSDNGMQYWVRFAPSLLSKPEKGDTAPNDDPLGKHEPELLVTEDLDGSQEFKVVLNKFPVMQNHALLVTNVFKDQSSRLTPQDLSTSYALIRDMNAAWPGKNHLVIYNSGPQSGSSQRHKHLQLLEFPQNFTPFQDELCSGETHFVPDTEHDPLQDRKVSFAHFVVPLPDSDGDVSAELLESCYFTLLQKVLTFFQQDLEVSYNVLLTRKWLCLVPRSNIRARSLQVGFNSIGYAGLVLVKKREIFDEVRSNPNVIDRLLLECGFPNTTT